MTRAGELSITLEALVETLPRMGAARGAVAEAAHILRTIDAGGDYLKAPQTQALLTELLNYPTCAIGVDAGLHRRAYTHIESLASLADYQRKSIEAMCKHGSPMRRIEMEEALESIAVVVKRARAKLVEYGSLTTSECHDLLKSIDDNLPPFIKPCDQQVKPLVSEPQVMHGRVEKDHQNGIVTMLLDNGVRVSARLFPEGVVYPNQVGAPVKMTASQLSQIEVMAAQPNLDFKLTITNDLLAQTTYKGKH